MALRRPQAAGFATRSCRAGGAGWGVRVGVEWPWIALFLLGCYHGINPGMGWLFAVALGLQERRARAVLAALPPIALGHAGSIAAVLLVARIAQAALPMTAVRLTAAALLAGLGISRLAQARHPRWVGMRVGFGGLSLWAFLMATGHGAGLMLLPIVMPREETMPGMHHPSVAGISWAGAVAVHTLGYALTMLAAALVVYWRLGLAFLRTRWFNLDVVWAAALLVTSAIMLVT
jgi:hypothetical protein